MGDPTGFLKVKRRKAEYRPVCERVVDYREVVLGRDDESSREQASRCMDCGTPFCHGNCPLGNWIPEWNDAVFHDRWRGAWELLDATNNLPEITGRLCPALCEAGCVLGINDDPVTVRENEWSIVERAFREGWVVPRPPARRTGKRVAVVGSGPAGLAAADQLNRAGHLVTVYERDDRIGGIPRLGIPDFKLDKEVIERRRRVWEAEGIEFCTGVEIGVTLPAAGLVDGFDAVLLAGGARLPRDLAVPGRELGGIHFAMDYLMQSNRRAGGETITEDALIDARGRKVVVIGGGDTGADCVGTAHRQGASCVVQIEVLDRPPEERPEKQPWPAYPTILRTSTSHEEGGERHWAVLTKRFIGEEGRVRRLECVRVEFPWDAERRAPVMREMPGSEFILEADLVVLAIGFLGPERGGVVGELELELDGRGNVKTDDRQMTSRAKVFAAGDMRRGQSLIVWAIAEGRRAATSIDEYLNSGT